MGPTVRHFERRRLVNLSLLLLCVAMISAWVFAREETLRETQRLTGWMGFCAVLFLAAFNIRKRLSFLPLGRSSTWMQLHIYVGWLSIAIYIQHAGLHVPEGIHERALAAAFLLLAGSGIIGLILTRYLPPLLARRGEEVIFERIPGFLERLRREAEEHVVASVKRTSSTAIADFYSASLARYMARHWDAWAHLFGFNASVERRQHDMSEFKLCLSTESAAVFEELEGIVSKKSDLDFHYYGQGALKCWFFVHLPMTWLLLGLLLMHVALVLLYGGAA